MKKKNSHNLRFWSKNVRFYKILVKFKKKIVKQKIWVGRANKTDFLLSSPEGCIHFDFDKKLW